MPDLPLVSAIITTHGEDRPFLAEAIGSVTGQDYPFLEVLVVDHGGSDLGDLVRRFPDVAFLDGTRLPKCVGAPRNLGVATSRGDLLAFLDHDDVWLPGKVAAQVRFFLDHPDVGTCFTQFEQYHESTGEVRPGFGRRPTYLGLLGGHIDNYPSSLMVRRALIDEIGGFSEDPRSAEDVDFTIRACQVAPSGFLDTVLLRYRIHGKNMTSKWRTPYFATDYTLRSHRDQALVRGDRHAARAAARGRRAVRPTYGRLAFEAFRQGAKGGLVRSAGAELAWALRLDPMGSAVALGRYAAARAARGDRRPSGSGARPVA